MGIGDNDGSMDGHKYFECPKNRGLFILEKHIKFKIKPRKKHHRKTSSSKTINANGIFRDKSSSLTPKSTKKISIKKLGPRDIGRNEKRTKTKKKSSNGKKKKKKFKKKTAENPKTIKIPKKYQNDNKTNKVSSN